MDSRYADELAVVFGALQAAARLSQAIISSPDTGVTAKEDLSPVTVADFAVQALLVATLGRAFPGDGFVGEEDAAALRADGALLARVWGLVEPVRPAGLLASKEQLCDLIDAAGAGSPQRGAPGRTWVLDPIDGTKTYVRRELYAINVALLVDGEQALGAVACPNMSADARGPIRNHDVDPAGDGCIVFAVKGHGAHVRPLAGAVDRVRPRRIPPLSASDGVRFVSCVNLVDSALEGVHEAVAERLGAAYPGCDLVPWVLRWAVLALGLGNATVWVYKRRDRFAKVWDHAGAMLLFEEVGGKISDVHGRPIDVTAGRHLSANFGFVAAPQELHSRVLEAVHHVLREQGHHAMLE